MKKNGKQETFCSLHSRLGLNQIYHAHMQNLRMINNIYGCQSSMYVLCQIFKASAKYLVQEIYLVGKTKLITLT